MFYVLIKEKDGSWSKTSYGAPDYDWSVKNFKGVPLKIEAEHGLKCARIDHPTETYRLIYSEEEF